MSDDKNKDGGNFFDGLEVFGGELGHRRKVLEGAAITFRKSSGYINPEAAKKLMIGDGSKVRALAAVNPHDGSVYFGVADSSNYKVRGYSIRKAFIKKVSGPEGEVDSEWAGALVFGMSKDASERLNGAYVIPEQIAKGTEDSKGVRWYPLVKLTE